jgi:hypothetical protein
MFLKASQFHVCGDTGFYTRYRMSSLSSLSPHPSYAVDLWPWIFSSPASTGLGSPLWLSFNHSISVHPLVHKGSL